MKALYCLFWKKWKGHLLASDKSYCKTYGHRCNTCPKCVWKEIEEESDE